MRYSRIRKTAEPPIMYRGASDKKIAGEDKIMHSSIRNGKASVDAPIYARGATSQHVLDVEQKSFDRALGAARRMFSLAFPGEEHDLSACRFLITERELCSLREAYHKVCSLDVSESDNERSTTVSRFCANEPFVSVLVRLIDSKG